MQPTLITPPTINFPPAKSRKLWGKKIGCQFPGKVPVSEPQMDTFQKASSLTSEVTQGYKEMTLPKKMNGKDMGGEKWAAN